MSYDAENNSYRITDLESKLDSLRGEIQSIQVKINYDISDLKAFVETKGESIAELQQLLIKQKEEMLELGVIMNDSFNELRESLKAVRDIVMAEIIELKSKSNKDSLWYRITELEQSIESLDHRFMSEKTALLDQMQKDRESGQDISLDLQSAESSLNVLRTLAESNQKVIVSVASKVRKLDEKVETESDFLSLARDDIVDLKTHAKTLYTITTQHSRNLQRILTKSNVVIADPSDFSGKQELELGEKDIPSQLAKDTEAKRKELIDYFERILELQPQNSDAKEKLTILKTQESAMTCRDCGQIVFQPVDSDSHKEKLCPNCFTKWSFKGAF